MAKRQLGVLPSRVDDAALFRVRRVLRLSADQTSTATALADTALMAALPVGTYTLMVYGLHQTSATGNGPRYGVGAGATGAVGAVSGYLSTPTAVTAPAWAAVTAANAVQGSNPAAATTLLPVEVAVSFTVTTAGTFGLRFACSATTVTATLKAGSFAVIEAVG